MNGQQARLSDTVIRPPSAVERFVNEAKLILPYNGVVWESPSWDIADADHTRAHLRDRRLLLFTAHAGSKVPLENRVLFDSAFADFVKACLVRQRVNTGLESGSQKVLLRAARYLFDAAPLRVRRDISLLSRGHFLKAESAVTLREEPSSAYRVAQHLEILVGYLNRFQLTRSKVNFVSRISRPVDLADKTEATFEERVAGLPTAETLTALATIANDPRLMENPFDWLLMRIVELLLVAAFRIGEALSLPVNPLLRQPALDEAGEPRMDAQSGDPIECLGIRHWPQKKGEPIVKWIGTICNPLVERALADIERLCLSARLNAQWLEAHPGKVNIDLNPDQMYGMGEVAQLLNLADATKARQWLTQRRFNGPDVITREEDRWYISGLNIERAVASDRYDSPMLVRRNGATQTLGQSLIVIFLNESHRKRTTNPYVSRPLKWGQVSDYLCGRQGVATSVFERYGVLDQDGRPFRIKSHDFRKFVDTILERGGLSEVEIAQWMGRKATRDNKAYDLRTAAEVAGEMRALIKENAVYGVIAEQVRQLPQTEQDEFLNSRLTMVHDTPYGKCGSNVGESPCEIALSCLGGCKHFFRVKGDVVSRESILKREKEAIVALERARDAQARGASNAASWVAAQETILGVARAALAIDDDPSIADGTSVRIRPGGAVRGVPL